MYSSVSQLLSSTHCLRTERTTSFGEFLNRAANEVNGKTAFIVPFVHILQVRHNFRQPLLRLCSCLILFVGVVGGALRYNYNSVFMFIYRYVCCISMHRFSSGCFIQLPTQCPALYVCSPLTTPIFVHWIRQKWNSTQ